MGRSTEVNLLREKGLYKGSATPDFAYHQEQAKAAHARVAANKTAIEKRTEVENRMGAMSALSGSSGKVYSTAEEYMDVRNQNDLIRRQANYRNFNSKAISEVLSAEEKAAFSRQRAVATGVKNSDQGGYRCCWGSSDVSRWSIGYGCRSHGRCYCRRSGYQ